MKLGDSLGLSNTQAERTSLLDGGSPQKYRVLLDWLGFSFVGENVGIYDVLSFFEKSLSIKMDSWLDGRSNYQGYAQSYVYENINIYFNGAQNQGIHVDITGQGCRYIEIIFEKLGVQFNNWYSFLEKLCVHEVNFSRIDIACDDFSETFNLEMILQKMFRGEVKSKFKSWRPDGCYNYNGENRTGITIYHGSTQSRVQCVMYEKNKQLGLDYSWNRTELRFLKTRANDIVNLILKLCDKKSEVTHDIGIIFAGVLKEYLTFLEPNPNDSNKRRWKVSPFWEDFLSGIEPLKFASCLPDRSIQKMYAYWERAMAKSLTMLTYSLHDNKPEFLADLFKIGKTKLKKEDMRIIEEYRRLVDFEKSNKNKLDDPIIVYTEKRPSDESEGIK